MTVEIENAAYKKKDIDRFIYELESIRIKLWIEGEALKYSAPKGVITKDILESLKDRKTEIIKYYQAKNAQKVYFDPIQKAEEREYYPLSAAQKRMFIINQIEGPSANYNISGAQTIYGKINKERIEEIFKTLVIRHDPLRTSFEMIDGEAVQRVQKSVDFKVDELTVNNEDEITSLIKSYIRPFDLGRAPLLRVGVIELADDKHIMVYDIHHIISDDASMKVLFRDFISLYNGDNLPELRVQYKDYTKWQDEMFESGIMKYQEEYWLDTFKGELPVLNLPTDYPRVNSKNINGDSVDFVIEEDVIKGLNRISSKNGSTLFMTLLAAFNVLLSKCSGQEDIILGAPIAGRSHVDVRNLLGVFLNTIALRNKPVSNKTFNGFLQEVRENTIKAYDNQDYQFDMLIDKLKIQRDMNRTPLFDIMINYLIDQNTEIGEAAGDLKIEPYDLEVTLSKFDMTLYFFYQGNKIKALCVYKTALFKRATVEYLMDEFQNLLAEIVKNPDMKLGEYDVFKKQDIKIIENTVKPVLPFKAFEKDEINQSIINRFEKQVKVFGDKVAVKKGSQQFTYNSLNKFANRIANMVIEKTNAAKTDSKTNNIRPRIALLFGHEVEMVASIFGVLKTGNIYVPLDPEYPKDRLSYMLSDSKAEILVTDNSNIKIAEELLSNTEINIEVLNIDNIPVSISEENPNIDIQTNQPAYILYTSGSTGRPKGVLQNHENVLYYIRAYTNNMHIDSSDKMTLFSSYCHDAAVVDIFSAILNGACLNLYNLKKDGDMEKLANWLNDECITVYHSIPTVFRYFTDSIPMNTELSRIRAVVLGGEAVFKRDVESYKKYFSNECIFVNLLGSTEASITMLNFIDKHTEIDKNSVSPGFPVEDMDVLLLDANGHDVNIFGIGQITYKSKHLALEYWNQPLKTSEVFKDAIEGEGKRIYMSGDMGRYLQNGSFEFVGRNDSQIKIRGYRIELGEIESVIDNIEGVQKGIAAAFTNDNGENYIAVYYVVKSGVDADSLEIEKILKTKLPSYMIPSYIVKMDELPKTPNGKINRKALQKPDTNTVSTNDYVEPADETEKALAEIWEDVLSADNVGANDNFFSLGGHSLKATTLVAKIHKVLNVQIPLSAVFQTQSLREMADYIKNSEKSKYRAISPCEEKEYYSLSAAQKRIFILSQMDKDNTSYNISGAQMIDGEIDKNLFEDVFKTLVERHDAFRTSFLIIDGEPVQKIQKHLNFEIEHIKITNEDEINATVNNFIRPFDLKKAPLFRVGLIELQPNRYVMVYDMHHIISDGSSMSVLTREFVNLYNRSKLPDLKIQYKDFSEWQNKQYDSDEMKKQEKYWLDNFSDQLPLLQLPTDFTRPSIQSYKGDHIKFTLGEDLLGKLNKVASKTGTTMFMVLLAAYNVLLHKYTGQEDIIVGSPVAGRSHADLENVIGAFINTLAYRSYPNPSLSFEEFLHEVKDYSLKAYENQDYQFEDLVQKLNIKRDLSRSPIFDTMFILQNMNMESVNLNGLILTPIELENKVSKFDITLVGMEVGNCMQFTLEYSTDLFKKDTMEKFIESFERVLNQIVNKDSVKISEIDIISDNERNKILNEFNNTYTVYPKDKTIHELFEAQVEKAPEKVALVFGKSTLTYRELNEKANQLARLLRNEGVVPDGIVGIMTSRSFDMLIGILAVLKAGGSYLPVDPGYPAGRVEYMLEDSGSKVLLTQKKLAGNVAFDGKVISLDDDNIFIGDTSNLENVTRPDNLAYVIYTSGSTGKPKGVMLQHRSVNNFIKGVADRIDFSPERSILALTTISFDIFVLETLLPLSIGLRVVIADENEQLEAKLLNRVIDENNVEMLQITPSRMKLLLRGTSDLSCLSKIKCIMLGGEPLPQNLLTEIQGLTDARIYNMYGPTETTVWSTIGELTSANMIDIGTPIANTRVYILDQGNNIKPVGIPGELCIAGDGLARGYLHRPDLTDEKFVPDPFYEGEKMYKTGDLARFLPDGRLECFGRVDQQVKIRGYRIELGEIEKQLGNCEGVMECAVVAKTDSDGNKYLVGYYTSSEELPISKLRSNLVDNLPDYMIPEIYVYMEKLPMTPNGKIDRKALPDPDYSRPKLATEFKEAKSETEKILVNIWKEILRHDTVGIEDNFFELGGNSLLLVKMHAELDKYFPGKVNVVDIFAFPTILKLSEKIDSSSMSKASAITLEKLKLPLEYFKTNNEDDNGCVIRFSLDSEHYINIAKIAEMKSANISDILLAAFVYVLYEVSENTALPLNIVINESGSLLSERFDLDNVKDIYDLILLAHQKQNNWSESTTYLLKDIQEINSDGEMDSVLLQFSYDYNEPCKEDLFDIALKAIENNSVLEFTCKYNTSRILKEKMDELIYYYIKTIETIIGG